MNDNDTQTTNEDPILIVAKTSFVYDEKQVAHIILIKY